MPNIRKAGCDDAHQLALIAERIFRETFGAHNSAEDMDLHCLRRYGEAIQADEIVASKVSHQKPTPPGVAAATNCRLTNLPRRLVPSVSF